MGGNAIKWQLNTLQNYKKTELLHSESEDIGIMFKVELVWVVDAFVFCLIFWNICALFIIARSFS